MSSERKAWSSLLKLDDTPLTEAQISDLRKPKSPIKTEIQKVFVEFRDSPTINTHQFWTDCADGDIEDECILSINLVNKVFSKNAFPVFWKFQHNLWRVQALNLL